MDNKRIYFELLISLNNYKRHDRAKNNKHLLMRNKDIELDIDDDASYYFFRDDLVNFLKT